MHRSFKIALPKNVLDVTDLLWTDFRLKRPVNKRIFLQDFRYKSSESPLTICLASLIFAAVFKVHILIHITVSTGVQVILK
jgi:hypothetical protein